MSRLAQMTITTEELSIGVGSSSCRKDLFGWWSQLVLLGEMGGSKGICALFFFHVFAWCTCPIYVDSYIIQYAFCQDDVQNTPLFSTSLSPGEICSTKNTLPGPDLPAMCMSSPSVIFKGRHTVRDIEKPKLTWNLVKADQKVAWVNWSIELLLKLFGIWGLLSLLPSGKLT